jgi:Tfp pilus assembly protein PilO
MRSLSARERLMISLVVSIGVAVLFYLFVLTPQNQRADELTRRLQQQQAQLDRLKNLAATREQKEREYQALADRIRLVEAKLPPEREIPDLIRALQAAASDVGVKLMLLRPGALQAGPAGAPPAQPAQRPAGQPAPAAEPRYRLFRLDLNFEGTYADMMALLARLEDFPRFMVLKQISMSPTEAPRLRITIAAETYVLPREALPGQ